MILRIQSDLTTKAGPGRCWPAALRGIDAVDRRRLQPRLPRQGHSAGGTAWPERPDQGWPNVLRWRGCIPGCGASGCEGRGERGSGQRSPAATPLRPVASPRAIFLGTRRTCRTSQPRQAPDSSLPPKAGLQRLRLRSFAVERFSVHQTRAVGLRSRVPRGNLWKTPPRLRREDRDCSYRCILYKEPRKSRVRRGASDDTHGGTLTAANGVDGA